MGKEFNGFTLDGIWANFQSKFVDDIQESAKSVRVEEGEIASVLVLKSRTARRLSKEARDSIIKAGFKIMVHTGVEETAGYWISTAPVAL